MKTASAGIGLVTLFALSAFAGPDVIIKQRAKELRDQNNVRQGVAPPTQPAQPAVAAPATPAPPAPSPAVTRFQSGLAALKASTMATADQKQKLAADLQAIAMGPKPSPASANKLASDLADAFFEKPLSSTSLARFTQEIDAVLNPTKYPQANLDGIIADVQAIFQANGLPRMKAFSIATGVKTLAAEVQKGGAR